MLSFVRSMRVWTLAAALVLGLVGLSSAAGGKKAVVSPFATQIKQLRAARALMQTGDHDYKGHRVAAVKEVSAAIHALNYGVPQKKKKKGSGSSSPKGGGEDQAVSDAQLKQAQQQIQAVLTQLGTSTDPRAVKAAAALTTAVKEIKTALTIK